MKGKKKASKAAEIDDDDTLSFFSLNRSSQPSEKDTRIATKPRISPFITSSNNMKRSQSDDLDISSDDDEKTDSDGEKNEDMNKANKKSKVGGAELDNSQNLRSDNLRLADHGYRGGPQNGLKNGLKNGHANGQNASEDNEDDDIIIQNGEERSVVEIEIDDSVDLDLEDSDLMAMETRDAELELETDPDLQAKIQERLARLKANKNATVFNVGLVFRNKIETLHLPVTAIKISSNDSFDVGRKKYIDELKRQKCIQDPGEQAVIQESAFVWQSTRIFDFSTPQLLHIKSTAPSMLIDVMTINQFQTMDQQRQEAALAFAESQDKHADDYDDVSNDNGKEPHSIEILDDDEEEDTTTNSAEPPKVDDGYFRIILKGKDNVPLEVKVNSETVISRLAEFYKTKRQLDATTPVKLEFDDEPLDPATKIGDTEIEEDFMIDVYVE